VSGNTTTETIQALLPRVETKADRAFLDAMLEQHRRARQKQRAYVDHVREHRLIHTEYVAATVDELAGPPTVFTIDTGMCTVWGARYLRATGSRRILGSFNRGSMANLLFRRRPDSNLNPRWRAILRQVRSRAVQPRKEEYE
jgi:pyruvate dehydrogenase (quinone)